MAPLILFAPEKAGAAFELEGKGAPVSFQEFFLNEWESERGEKS